MQILGLLIVGLIIGFLARAILPGRQKIGLLWTLVLGVAGALIGGTIASALAAGDIFELNFVGFIVAVVSSVALLAAMSAFRPHHTPTIPQSNCSDSSEIGTNTPTAANTIDHLMKRVSSAPMRMPSSANTAAPTGWSSANSGQAAAARSSTASSPVNA